LKCRNEGGIAGVEYRKLERLQFTVKEMRKNNE